MNQVSRILIVDENPGSHRDLEQAFSNGSSNSALESAGPRRRIGSARAERPKRVYALDHAFSGSEGLKKISQSLREERPYQVAFVGLRMPGMEGLEIIQKAWQMDRFIQMVICSASGGCAWDGLGRQLGWTDKLLVLKQPFAAIEALLLAGALSEKSFLARRAGLKPSKKELPGTRALQAAVLQGRALSGSRLDALFLRRTQAVIEKHLADFTFDVDALAQRLAVSRRQIFRKLRALTGRTPSAVIRSARLNRAAQLLNKSGLSVSAVTYAVGFSDLKHFRAVFRKQFGVLPGEYPRKIGLPGLRSRRR